ncbi:MAG: hypothetical protein J6K88_02460 [Oscillospiraceae bacterium]|nr:hypothetical protein [Oscillospiraceae bacterium]
MKTADIFIPKDSVKGENSLFVSVNGKHYSIMRGIKVTVPIEVKEVIEASLLQSREADDFIKNNTTV